jgi:hypothetical protein
VQDEVSSSLTHPPHLPETSPVTAHRYADNHDTQVDQSSLKRPRHVRNSRHVTGENVSNGPCLSLESRTAIVPWKLATSTQSPPTEALLFRHDAVSGLFGSDIEPLSDPWKPRVLRSLFVNSAAAPASLKKENGWSAWYLPEPGMPV